MVTDERERWSPYQLLQHSFIKLPDPSSVGKNGELAADEHRDGAGACGDGALQIKKHEPEEPIPDFCFFSGAGKSRIKSEFEQLQFLGKGGFGNVIKVCYNDLDDNCDQ